ncbi:MAG: hypothetical protein ACYTGR_02690 [Planctomycetota bacterium]|jgi:uncharacterized membrane protein
MKTILELVKSMLLGGLFVLLPLLLLYLMISEAVELVIAMATPIVEVFPEGTFGSIQYPAVLAFAVILGISLAIGIAMRSTALRRAGRRFEGLVLDRLPLYRALTSLLRGFTSGADEAAFKAAVMKHADDVRELVYVVEDTGGTSVTILRPHAPAGFIGTVAIVPRARIEKLGCTIGDVSRVLGQWGIGAHELLGE